MSLEIYDTLTREKRAFEPLEPGKVSMYVCGPTVYAKAHVGHAMSSLVFDVIRRYLQYKDFEVTHIMNYTDVDDKVIRRANELGMEPEALSERYIREYNRHLRDLGVLPAHVNPRVSQEMDHILHVVKGLLERDLAYVVEGDVYFRVSRGKDYGKLSGRALEDMRAGARLEVDERKEDPGDFALWKAAKPGEPSWESPWGEGRPGWHIECSAMCLRHLGEQIDIHGGGNDLIFPHHENEIAQSEGFTDRPFASFWIHNGMMRMGGEDMSKSTGNVFTIEAFLEHHEADALRLLILGSHYRSPLKFTGDVISQAERGLERLRGALRPARPSPRAPLETAKALRNKDAQARSGFEAAMDDDFNTPIALSHLYDLVRAINQARDAGVSSDTLEEAQATLCVLAGVLGLRLDVEEGGRKDIGPLVDLLIDVRTRLRSEKQWAMSDWIRDRLSELGISLEDTPEGTTWRSR
jgi:cysteinyl-tRNA synthetase